MDNMRRFETISDYNAFNNNETLHPLVSVVDLVEGKSATRFPDVFRLLHHILKRCKMR